MPGICSLTNSPFVFCLNSGTCDSYFAAYSWWTCVHGTRTVTESVWSEGSMARACLGPEIANHSVAAVLLAELLRCSAAGQRQRLNGPFTETLCQNGCDSGAEELADCAVSVDVTPTACSSSRRMWSPVTPGGFTANEPTHPPHTQDAAGQPKPFSHPSYPPPKRSPPPPIGTPSSLAFPPLFR